MERREEKQLHLTLPPDLQEALTKAAEEQGTSPDLLALNCIRERYTASDAPSVPEENGLTLSDFLAGHIGTLSSSEHISGGARLSEDSGRKFAAALGAKRQEGRL